MDELFLCAYAPQETDDLNTRHTFFQALLEIIHSVPRRTRVWLLGDFNGHIGQEFWSPAVGPHTNEITNNNGSSLVHACEASGLLLANTFIGGGPTCWTPDGSSSHCIDFIAIPKS